MWSTIVGLGNAVSALMGGFGGCGLIPNTVLNARAGGKGALSAIGYAVFLSLAVVTAAPAIGSIPLAALAGLMLNVAINTFEWAETKKVFGHAWDNLRLGSSSPSSPQRKHSQQAWLDFVGLCVTCAVCVKVITTINLSLITNRQPTLSTLVYSLHLYIVFYHSLSFFGN